MQKSLFAFGVKKITPKESEKGKDEERKETKNRIAADRAKKVLVKQKKVREQTRKRVRRHRQNDAAIAKKSDAAIAKKGLRQYRNLCNGSCATLHVTPCVRQTCANVTLHGLTAATYIASTVLLVCCTSNDVFNNVPPPPHLQVPVRRYRLVLRTTLRGVVRT